MTLLEKLAPYLPYGLKFMWEDEELTLSHLPTYGYGNLQIHVLTEYKDAKPILKPMSDLLESDLPYLVNDHNTDYFADTDNYIKAMEYIDRNIFHHYTEFLPYGLINWLIKNHYDVFGMIESGEAIDINTLSND